MSTQPPSKAQTGRGTAAAAKTAAQPAPAADNAWRQFPQFEKIFETGQLEPFLRKMEATCRRLEELSKNGPDKERAATALAAYVRTFELIRQVAEERNRLAAAK